MEKEPILLLTHNGWGIELLKSIQVIAGKVENVQEVALMPEDSLEDYLTRVREKLDELNWNKKLLVITDLKGGTPCNVALRLSKDYELVIISGLCSSLLLEAVMNQEAGGFTDEIAHKIRQDVVDTIQVLSVV